MKKTNNAYIDTAHQVHLQQCRYINDAVMHELIGGCKDMD